MSRKKYPSELNTRLIRVFKEDHERITKFADKKGITVAEALRRIIRDVLRRSKTITPKRPPYY